MGYAGAPVLEKNGNPVEGEEIQIIPQDNTKVVIEGNSFVKASKSELTTPQPAMTLSLSSPTLTEESS